MGERGPQPRRDAERRRANEPAHPIVKMGPTQLSELPFEVDVRPEPPEQPGETEKWHPVVQGFWDSLQRDPARKWMTSADWAASMLMCESMSRELSTHIIGTTKDGEAIMGQEPVKGATLGNFMRFLAQIGVTEAGRLRLQKEITLFPPLPTQTNGTVVDIREARGKEVQ